MTKARNVKYYALIGVIIVLAILVLLIAYILTPRGKPVVPLKPEAYLEIVRDGDIICRLGDRLWSQMFKECSFEDKRYSHAGVIRIDNGRITVIHAEGTTELGRDFVKEDAFDDFIEIARAFGIYRTKGIDGNLVSSMAMEYLNVPFDWQFDLDDNSKIYCTELLYIILKRLSPTIELKTMRVREFDKTIIPLDSISRSEFFTEVYYIGNDYSSSPK